VRASVSARRKEIDMLMTILLIAAGVLAGGIAALKVIAPKTATTKDDEILARLEALEAIVEKLRG
jgi:hypothetical protein